jgi:hypothetical protein
VGDELVLQPLHFQPQDLIGLLKAKDFIEKRISRWGSSNEEFTRSPQR